MSGFVKVDSGILDSSVWLESPETRVVWFTMLVKADMNGFVGTSKGGLWRASNVERSAFDAAIATLESPDSDSRSSEFEGRRIQKIEGGWQILNYEKYRQFSYSGSKEAERKRAYRKQKINDLQEKSGTKVGHVPKCPGHSASASVSVLNDVSNNNTGKSKDTEKEKDPNKRNVDIHTESSSRAWTKDLKIYLEEHSAAFNDLLANEIFLDELQEFYPNLDLKATLLKSKAYWHSEKGWKRKKRTTRKGRPDWFETYRNACSMDWNQVIKNGPPRPSYGRQIVSKETMEAQFKRLTEGEDTQ